MASYMVSRALCLALIFSQVSSFLIIPIQGVTISNFILLFFLFPAFLLMPALHRERVIFSIVVFSFFLLYMLSQASIAVFGNIEAPDVPMVESNSGIEMFKGTHLTQSLYVLPGLLLSLFVKRYFTYRVLNFFVFGQLLIAIIGVLEVAYNYYSGGVFDFLVNRSFRDGSASAEQYINGVLRLKSLTGEASMYVFSVFPGFIISIGLKKYKTAAFLFISLILTFSSTLIISSLSYALLVAGRYLLTKYSHKYSVSRYVLALLLLSVGFLIFSYFFESVYNYFIVPFFEKVSMSTLSGTERIGNIFDGMSFILTSPFLFFGVGFGSFRSTDFLTTLFLNVGVVGFFITSCVVFCACLRAYKKKLYFMGDAVLVSYLMALVSVPEFAYLTPWFLIGAAYSRAGCCEFLFAKRNHNRVSY